MAKEHGQASDLPEVTADMICAGQVTLTPAMVDAGVYAAREHCLGEPLSELVTKVYIAMAIESER
jgi:hypothetical protein